MGNGVRTFFCLGYMDSFTVTVMDGSVYQQLVHHGASVQPGLEVESHSAPGFQHH